MSQRFSNIPLTPLGRQLLRIQVGRLNQHARVLGGRLREAWLNNDALNRSLLRDELTQVENRIRELEEAIAERG
jgi:hypothetical protein